jgi:hypothetical protein
MSDHASCERLRKRTNELKAAMSHRTTKTAIAINMYVYVMP